MRKQNVGAKAAAWRFSSRTRRRRARSRRGSRRARARRRSPSSATATIEHAKQAVLDLAGSAIRARSKAPTSAAVHAALEALGSERQPHRGRLRRDVLAARRRAAERVQLSRARLRRHARALVAASGRAGRRRGARRRGAHARERRAADRGDRRGYDVAVRVGLALDPARTTRADSIRPRPRGGSARRPRSRACTATTPRHSRPRSASR